MCLDDGYSVELLFLQGVRALNPISTVRMLKRYICDVIRKMGSVSASAFSPRVGTEFEEQICFSWAITIHRVTLTILSIPLPTVPLGRVSAVRYRKENV